MKIRYKRFVKLIIFFVLFYFLCVVAAFFLKNDTVCYSRTIGRDFWKQQNIDILVCGASHVSHGIDARIADKKFNQNIFNSGTSSQSINSTYAIIKQAIKQYDIKKIFLETDYQISCIPVPGELKMTTKDFLVMDFLRDKKIKNDYIFESSSPRNLLNAYLPIGNYKKMCLEPKKIGKKIIYLFNGKYNQIDYKTKNTYYAGKGCLLDKEFIPDGEFYATSLRGGVNPISSYWKDYVIKIINLCKKNDIELFFYTTPLSDFLLYQLGNYEDYHNEMKSFLENLGYYFYDFNLLKPEYSMSDSDFYDDNHLNKYGIKKFTECFCSVFAEKMDLEDVFYKTYSEKKLNSKDKIFGLLITNLDNTFCLKPITNVSDLSRIKYSVTLKNNENKLIVQNKSPSSNFILPDYKSSEMNIISYLDDKIQNTINIKFNKFGRY